MSHIQTVKGVKLDNNGGFGSLRFDMTEEARELDENVNECEGRSKRPG